MKLEAIASHEKYKQKPLLSREILTLCSYLAADNIPYVVIKKWLANCYTEQEVETGLENALAFLSDYSLITVNEDKQHVSLHHLVQALMRHQHTQQFNNEDRVDWLQQVIDSIINTYNQEVPFRKKKQWRLALLPHLHSLLHHAKENKVASIKQALLVEHISEIILLYRRRSLL